MKELNIDQINCHAPYDVCCDRDGAILFRTDYGVEYSVTFDDDANPYFTAYWFNLSNMNARTSPGDPKVAQTVICIIEEFFRQNPDILLYIARQEVSRRNAPGFSFAGSMARSRRSTMSRGRWRYAEKRERQNMWR